MRVDGIAYDTAGSGDPVVLLHGGMLDRHSWDAEFALLSAARQVVRYDARGHGESDAATGDYATYDDLFMLLDHLGLPRVTGIGLSLGARTLIDAALLHPQRFAALVLVSPGHSGMEFADPFALAHIKAAAEAGGPDALVEVFLRAWVDGPHRSPEDVDPAVREQCRAAGHKAVAKMRGGGGLREVGAAGRFGELTMPVDIVLGDLDSTDILAAGERIAADAPDSRIHRVAGAGHSLNLEQPAAFAAVLQTVMSGRATPPRST